MRPLMPPVQTPDNLFHNGNPLTGELGTIVDSEHLNNVQSSVMDVQSELISVLTAAGIETDPAVFQLLSALQILFAENTDSLGALAGLVGVANKLPYFTGANSAALTTLTSIGRDIIGKNTLTDLLTYLGLGTAAKRDVGTGENQIPDMSAFSYLTTGTGQPGYTFLPNGILLQWGTILPSASDISTSFPILFPTTIFAVLATSGYTPGAGTAGVSSIGTAINPSVRGSFVSRNTSPTLGGRFLAIGN